MDLAIGITARDIVAQPAVEPQLQPVKHLAVEICPQAVARIAGEGTQPLLPEIAPRDEVARAPPTPGELHVGRVRRRILAIVVLIPPKSPITIPRPQIGHLRRRMRSEVLKHIKHLAGILNLLKVASIGQIRKPKGVASLHRTLGFQLPALGGDVDYR